jgi:hypothetical protein
MALAIVGSGSAQPVADPLLQGRLLLAGDGSVYVYKDGVKYQVQPAPLTDDDIGAITSADQPILRVDTLFSPATQPTAPVPPTPTPVPAPKPGDVLYQADWSKGLNGWVSGGHWAIANGMLVNTGDGVAFPPYTPTSPDYAVEAEIQLLHPDCSRGECVGIGGPAFGVLARADTSATPGYGPGYGGGASMWVSNSAVIHSNDGFMRAGGSKDFASKPYSPQFSWHTYRLDTQGNVLKLWVDGVPLLNGTDNGNLQNVAAGVFAWDSAQVQVRSFRVVAN